MSNGKGGGRSWGGQQNGNGGGYQPRAGVAVRLWCRISDGTSQELPAGEFYFQGNTPSGDIVCAFRNNDQTITVRRVDGLLGEKLAETKFLPGAMAAWGATPDGGEPSVWVGPGGATFMLEGTGQSATLKAAVRS